LFFFVIYFDAVVVVVGICSTSFPFNNLSKNVINEAASHVPIAILTGKDRAKLSMLTFFPKLC